MNEPAPPPPPTSTLPLLVAAKPPSVTLAGKSCYPSGAFGAPPTSPRKKLTLPHFTSSNGADFQSPRRRHYQSNPERFEPQDPRTTPLEKAIEELRHAKDRIHACFERIDQTQELFEQELGDTNAMMDKLHMEQQWLASAYYNYFTFSATQIQRQYRGHLGRRVYHQSVALKAALRIQRNYRAMRKRRLERARRFRLLCRKMLRGMRGIRAKEELSHKELLNRVNRNMVVETQWRNAMGVGDTESTLINALYRKKFMRKRIGAVFRHLYWINSIVRYWKALVPETAVPDSDIPSPCESSANPEELDSAAAVELAPPDAESEEHLDQLSEWNPQDRRVSPNRRAPPGNGKQDQHSKAKSPISQKKTLSREELRRKQQVYNQRVHDENLKRETARAVQLEKQREAARFAEFERQRMEEEQRRLRMEHAIALRDDLERRGLLAIKELQSKKDEELRKQEEAKVRLEQAQQKIVAEVLSDETQQLLKRKHKSSRTPRKS